LGFFMKHFDLGNSQSTELTYSFYHNENLPQFIFIGVIVALFLGLTLAAEEIIKDRNLLKRERFLGLSKASYLLSKIAIMFSISAIQIASFVLIGNCILEIPNLFWDYWYILFSVACFSNILGLIISATFNSAKVIYLMVPLMIIPQLLFSGVIVKFDKLNPLLTSQKSVPLIGNLMVTRWAYEGLLVSTKNISIHNDKLYFWSQLKAESAWKRDYWIPEMSNQMQILENPKSKVELKIRAKRILFNEIIKESSIWSNYSCKECLSEGSWSLEQIHRIKSFIEVLKKQYQIQFETSTDSIDQFIRKLGDKEYAKFQAKYGNQAINELAMNRRELNSLVIYEDELIQKTNPYYQITEQNSFFGSPLYVREKSFFGTVFNTPIINVIYIWLFTIGMYFILYFDLFKRLLKLEVFKASKK